MLIDSIHLAHQLAGVALARAGAPATHFLSLSMKRDSEKDYRWLRRMHCDVSNEESVHCPIPVIYMQ
jgi:hypothetical protein